VLAYVFWHRPAAGTADASYGRLAGALHAALADDPPEGFAGSASYLVDDVPWLAPGGTAVEDWYLVEGWSALGALEEAALDAGRRLPTTQLRRPRAPARAPSTGSWRARPSPAAAPAGPTRRPERRRTAALWRRRLVLGPAPQWVALEGGDAPGRERVG
jgi:hypothetical protein